MYDVMAGIRVVELAEQIFVPSTAMILADWGAEVIKVERAKGGGDPVRTMAIYKTPGARLNPHFELANRGKRSIGLDLTNPAGRELLYKLLETADVFVTSLRADARAKLGVEAAEVTARNPRIIYGRGTGYGLRGPMRNHGGFDYPSSWCRSGSAFAQTPPDGREPPMQPGSVGDLMSGATLAGAIAAALFRRERTGKGAVVDNALYHVGAYIMTQSVTGTALGVTRPPPVPRTEAGFPLVNLYKTKDGRWISLCLLMEAWWPDLARHLGREDWLDDPRYRDEAARHENRGALIAELDKIFAAKSLEEWKQALSTLQGVWAPLQSPAEVLADEQALVNGFVTPVTAPDGTSYLSSATPGQFDERPIGSLRASPAFGQDTDDILRELGLQGKAVDSLRQAGIVA